MQIDMRVKEYLNDFIVEEVPLLPEISDQNAEFTYIRVVKRMLSTFDLIMLISNYLEIESEKVSASGLKDEDGVTSQLISVRSQLANDDLMGLTDRHAEILSASIVGCGRESLSAGRLHGNNFRIRIRVQNEEQCRSLNDTFKRGGDVGFVNYYDSQRFGLPDSIPLAHRIGQSLLDRDYDTALAAYTMSGNKDAYSPADFIDDPRSFFSKIDPRKINFFLSAEFSWRWNQTLSDYLSDKGFREVVTLEGLSDLVFLKNFSDFDQIPMNHAVPCWQYGVDEEFTQSDKSRRTYQIARVFSDGCGIEDAGDQAYVDLCFYLPSGSYATMLIKQIASVYVDAEYKTSAA